MCAEKYFFTVSLHIIIIVIRMKFISHFALLAVCTALFSACFQDEPLNSECDIEEAKVTVENMEDVFFNPTDARFSVPSTDSVIVFHVRTKADLTRLAPEFKLTEGATISPQSGSMHDFSAGSVVYTVTSQDGLWHRTYRVSFQKTVQYVAEELKFDFENYALDPNGGKYYFWKEDLLDGGLGKSWTSGNLGFSLSRGDATPEEYPTTPMETAYEGKGVRLTTRSTGTLGAMVGKRLAAGNLFLGAFDLASALTNTLKATRFGVPFTAKPLRLTGYYTYIPGTKYQDAAGNEVQGTTDTGAIYAVLYRNHDSNGAAIYLYGDDVLSSQQIVAVADIGAVKAAKEWTLFDIPFEYKAELDPALLAARGYSLTIVFSSSSSGAEFKGAIGSTMCVDKVSLQSEITKE